jgi:hypothetical protein
MSRTPLVEPPMIPPPEQTGMPRRFGIGSIMVVTAAFSLLFLLLKLAQEPIEAYLVFAGFFTIIAIAQAILFGGRNPRKASIATGVVVVSLVSMFMPALKSSPARHSDALDFVFVSIVGAIGGAIYGYVAGALIGGVFLMMESADKYFHPPQDESDIEIVEFDPDKLAKPADNGAEMGK